MRYGVPEVCRPVFLPGYALCGLGPTARAGFVKCVVWFLASIRDTLRPARCILSVLYTTNHLRGRHDDIVRCRYVPYVAVHADYDRFVKIWFWVGHLTYYGESPLEAMYLKQSGGLGAIVEYGKRSGELDIAHFLYTNGAVTGEACLAHGTVVGYCERYGDAVPIFLKVGLGPFRVGFDSRGLCTFCLYILGVVPAQIIQSLARSDMQIDPIFLGQYDAGLVREKYWISLRSSTRYARYGPFQPTRSGFIP